LVEQQKPQDAVRLCLQVIGEKPNSAGATAIAQFMTQLYADSSRATKVDPELKQRALRAIDDALDADRGNLNLLMSSAVLQATLNENTEAIRLFRRVVEIEPRQSLALNNLATLLSEQPDKLEEAQEFVQRAIATSGRQPALLDTLGTILLRAKKFKPAIEALEEAVAGSANDPRYYFHLAAAYDGDGQTAMAEEKLKIALELGLEKTILTSGDRALLASLKKQTLTQN
jgi:Tfp pilus assembly protein PilF